MPTCSPTLTPPSEITAFELEPIGLHRGMYIFDRSYFKALAKTGVTVNWVTSSQIDVNDDGYKVYPLLKGIFGSDWPLWRGLRYMHGLWKLLALAKREARTKRVIIHQQFIISPLVEIAFVHLAHMLGIPCVLAPHDVLPYHRSIFTKPLLPLLYRTYDALIVHSEAARAELENILSEGINPMWLIPHGNLNAYRKDSRMSQQVARSILGIPERGGVILFFGQIKREKGLDILLQAMPAVLERNPDTTLIIAGQPYHCDIDEYEQLIDGLGIRSHVKVRWEYVPEEQIAAYYRAANVVVLPYLRSYQSGVCLTAYAYARPVVATSVGGLKEQVLDGETGYLVSPHSGDQLADALNRMLNSGALAQQMGESGYKWAEKNGDWEHIAQVTLSIYQDCLRRSKQKSSEG